MTAFFVFEGFVDGEIRDKGEAGGIGIGCCMGVCDSGRETVEGAANGD